MHHSLSANRDGQVTSGGPERHTCVDGSAFMCAGGTRGCVNDSPMYCAQPVGKPEIHTCGHGEEFTCSGGSQGCFDFSPTFCKSPGAMETHVCDDGKKFECISGTEGCFDGSKLPKYCKSTEQCETGDIAICWKGAYWATF